MNNKSEVVMNNNFNVRNLISWPFGIAVFAIGVLNVFWGNDFGFGVFIILLSLVYVPSVECHAQSKDRSVNSWRCKNLPWHFYTLGCAGRG